MDAMHTAQHSAALLSCTTRACCLASGQQSRAFCKTCMRLSPPLLCITQDINLAKRGLAGGANETANTTTTTGGAARDTASGAGTAKRQRARAAKEEAARQQEQRDRGRDREDDDSEAEQEATPSGTAGGGEEAEL